MRGNIRNQDFSGKIFMNIGKRIRNIADMIRRMGAAVFCQGKIRMSKLYQIKQKLGQMKVGHRRGDHARFFAFLKDACNEKRYFFIRRQMAVAVMGREQGGHQA